MAVDRSAARPSRRGTRARLRRPPARLTGWLAVAGPVASHAQRAHAACVRSTPRGPRAAASCVLVIVQQVGVGGRRTQSVSQSTGGLAW